MEEYRYWNYDEKKHQLQKSKNCNTKTRSCIVKNKADKIVFDADEVDNGWR